MTTGEQEHIREDPPGTPGVPPLPPTCSPGPSNPLATQPGTHTQPLTQWLKTTCHNTTTSAKQCHSHHLGYKSQAQWPQQTYITSWQHNQAPTYLYFTVPHLSLRTPCGLHKSVRSLYGVRMESTRTARTMLVKKKNARSPCGLRADLLNFTIKKTIILKY
jgi:hypothetical protein